MVAIDFHLQPYYGEPSESKNELYYGEARQGTTTFHAYATACIIDYGERYTVALTWVRRHETVEVALQRLIERIREIGLKIRRLQLDRGFFTCHDARTGKEIYGKQRIDPAAAAFTASPWASAGKIFALSEDGDTFVIQAGPEFKLLGKNTLDEMCMATPAVYRSSLIVRTAQKLYRIQKGGAR